MSKFFAKKNIGNLLSSLTLFSPLKCLTSLFGMGRGVSTLLSSPIKIYYTIIILSKQDNVITIKLK